MSKSNNNNNELLHLLNLSVFTVAISPIMILLLIHIYGMLTVINEVTIGNVTQVVQHDPFWCDVKVAVGRWNGPETIFGIKCSDVRACIDDLSICGNVKVAYNHYHHENLRLVQSYGDLPTTSYADEVNYAYFVCCLMVVLMIFLVYWLWLSRRQTWVVSSMSMEVL